MSTNYIDQITDTTNTTHDISEGDSTRIFRATCATAAGTTAKVATLQTSNRNFSLTAGVRVAVTFTYGNTATTPTLRVDGSSTGTAKTIAVATSATARTTGNGTTYNTWGPYETIIFTYDGTYWVQSGSSRSIYNAYSLAASKGTGTVTSVGVQNATNGGLTVSGSPITTSGTITVGHSNVLSSAQTTAAVYPIKIDKNGHISEYGTAVEIPDTSGFVLRSGDTMSGNLTFPSSTGVDFKYTSSDTDYTTKLSIIGINGSASSYVPRLSFDKVTILENVQITKSQIRDFPTITDTKNTAGSNDTSSKIFLIGTTSQTTGSNALQTYSHDTAYVGTNGHLYSAGKEVLVGGSNASSSVSITPSTTTVYSMTSAGSVTAGKANTPTQIDTSKFDGGSLTFSVTGDNNNVLDIEFTPAALQTGFCTPGTANTPTAVTLPGRSNAITVWTGYTAATAAAQTFTGAKS